MLPPAHILIKETIDLENNNNNNQLVFDHRMHGYNKAVGK